MMSSSENKSLLDLNDDCLRLILSYASWADKARLALTCNHFRTLVVNCLNSREILEYHDIVEGITLDETREFLGAVGQHITRLVCYHSYKQYTDYIELLHNYCNNLEEVEFCGLAAIPYKGYSRMLRANENIQKLNFSDCFHITDRVCSQISRLKNLQHLNLTNNWKFSGKHLSSLTSLKELLVARCAIESKHMVEICEALQLKRLDISLCNALSQSDFQVIVDTQNELDTLTISDTFQDKIQVLAKVKNLKHLEITFNSDTNMLAAVVEHKGNNLETFILHSFGRIENCVKDFIPKFSNIRKICLQTHPKAINEFVDREYLLRIAQNCPQLSDFICQMAIYINDDAVVPFIEAAKNLKRLDISSSKVTNQLYDRLIEVLRCNNGQLVVRKLKLCAFNTKMTAAVINEEKCRENHCHIGLCLTQHPPLGF